MNNQIKLAVAAALLAAASSANAGISIPAGDWTLDIGGVVNAFYTSTRVSGNLANGTAPLGIAQPTSGKTASSITTGLLPNYISFSGKTRQNDLDVAFTISMNPGGPTTGALDQNPHQENRQAFLTFGDASWGSVKLGKDIGVFASDAILNDMTLLGVGSNAGALSGASNTTTTGRIGTGYIYADWKEQISYTTPNLNGFSATVALTNAFNAAADGSVGGVASTGRGGSEPAFEGKASYSWTGDVAGKVWVSGISQKVEGLTNAVGAKVTNPTSTSVLVVAAVPNTAQTSDRAQAADIGANVNVAGLSLTGYYYSGSGIGQTGQLHGGFDATGHSRDSNGGYVQATYVLPTATKIGASWGESILDGNAGEFNQLKDEMWTIGAYHPLTKHLNLVAEYSDVKRKVDSVEGKSNTVSLGAILFF